MTTVLDALSDYPRSRASTVSDGCPVVRSRTWSDDITKTWNLPISGMESLHDRAERYKVYFTMTEVQLRTILDRFVAEIHTGLEVHQQDPKAVWDRQLCSLKMVDTCVNVVPTGNEVGAAIALDFGGPDPALIRAVRVNLEGKGSVKLSEVSVNLRDAEHNLSKGLLDASATASMLFDQLVQLVKELRDTKMQDIPTDQPLPIGFTVCFPVEQRSLDCARLIHWVKGFETGRKTNDPVEGMDVVALLNVALERNGVPGQTKAIINDTTGALLTCAYERPSTSRPCRVGFILGSGVNGCYVQPTARNSFNYRGTIINTELGSFDKSLPVNDVDLEIDFADESTKGFQLFEKMVAASFLGELCRRLVVKVWQNAAPPLAWVRQSMPWQACARVIGDSTPDRQTVGMILRALWEWDTETEARLMVQSLFNVVFERSAALAATAILALAMQTERLQAAMGGVTVGVGGPLFSECPLYAEKLKKYIAFVKDEEAASLIDLRIVIDSSAKAAGIVASMLSKNAQN